MAKHILIAGGCGFVGSNLALLLKEKYPAYEIIALDNLKRRGSETNIPRLLQAGIRFQHGDIRNKEDLAFGLPLHTIVDAAAEPSVMAGIGHSTDYLVQTNFNGTINLLDLAVQHKADLIFLSTSRVYPIGLLEQLRYTETDTRFVLGNEQALPGSSSNGINEDFSLKGARSFYGSSKLAAELMIREYETFFGIKAVINRCGVITGPYQMGKVDQGVVVLWMARHFWNREIQYFGYGGQGKQVRDILHIHDLFRLVDLQMHDMEKCGGQLYNVGGGKEVSISLRELTKACAAITGNKVKEKSIRENRAGDIPIYITDNTHVIRHTGWAPVKTVPGILADIFKWIQQDEKILKPILDQ